MGKGCGVEGVAGGTKMRERGDRERTANSTIT